MKYNTAEVATLQPDYIGFIFFEKSPRNFEGSIPALPSGVKKVGVFVNASEEQILSTIKAYQLDVVQLHGDEPPAFCAALRKKQPAVALWKVFSIKDSFDFKTLSPFENYVDAFLFDTQGVNKGGNGFTFDWSVLSGYPSEKPFILSGGIGREEIPALKEMLTTRLPILAIDVNSRFESAPGKKDVSELKTFMDQLEQL